jgi:hypothetical protein
VLSNLVRISFSSLLCLDAGFWAKATFAEIVSITANAARNNTFFIVLLLQFDSKFFVINRVEINVRNLRRERGKGFRRK